MVETTDADKVVEEHEGAVPEEDAPGDSRRKWYLIGAGLAILALMLGGWYLLRDDVTVSLPTASDPTVAAMVGDSKISVAELDREVEAFKSARPGRFEDADESARLRAEVLNTLIDRALIAQEADARGVTVTDEAVEAQVNALIDSYGSKEAFEESMGSGPAIVDALRGKYRTDLLADALLRDLTGDAVLDNTQRDTKLRSLLDELRAKTAIEIRDKAVLAWQEAGNATASE